MSKSIRFILIFNLIWIVSLVLSSININRFFKVDNYTYFIIITGLISLNFGLLVSKFIKLNTLVLKLNKKKIKYIEIINKIYLIVNIWLSFKIIILLRKLPYAAIRDLQFPKFGDKEIIYGNKYLRILYHMFGNSLNYILMIVLIYLYFNTNTNKKLKILLALNIFLNSFITGSRILIGNLILITCIYLLNYYKNVKKKIPLLKIGVLIFILNLMSEYRSWNSKDKVSIFKTVSTYYQGAINMLDYYLFNIDKYEIYYGRLNISIFDIPVSMVLKKIFNFQIKSAFESFNFINSQFINIGGKKYNALYTIFQSFYADYKEIGVIIFSVIYGLLIGFFIRKYEKSLWFGVVISYVQVLVFQSLLKNHLIGDTFIIIISFCFWLSIKNKGV